MHKIQKCYEYCLFIVIFLLLLFNENGMHSLWRLIIDNQLNNKIKQNKCLK